MTDQVEENQRRVRYLVTDPAGQNVFDLTFPISRILDKNGAPVSPVAVYVNGAEIAETDFTYDADDLTVTLDVNAPQNSIVVIEGDRLVKRSVGYPLRGGLSSILLNDDMNAVIEMLQEIRRDINRGVLLNKSEGNAVSAQLPLLSSGKGLKWGPYGLENTLVDIDNLDAAIAQVEAAADAVLAARDETEDLRDEGRQARDAAQAAAAGMKWRPTVRMVTTGNDTLSGLAARNGVTPVAGDRVLVMANTAPAQNGVYIAAAGAWQRAADADSWAELIGQVVITEEGATGSDQAYICTVNQGGTLGTSPVTWTSFNPPMVIASQAEAEAHTDNTKAMTSLRVWQKITAAFATAAEILAGTANRIVSAASLKSWFDANVKPVIPVGTALIVNGSIVTQAGGLNLSVSVSGGLYTFTIGNPLANANYHVMVSPAMSENGVARGVLAGESVSVTKTASQFGVASYLVSSGVAIAGAITQFSIEIHKY